MALIGINFLMKRPQKYHKPARESKSGLCISEPQNRGQDQINGPYGTVLCQISVANIDSKSSFCLSFKGVGFV